MTDADYVNMSAFSCGVAELDNFFRYEVKDCVEKHYLSAYCAVAANGDIIAAFTLMNDALMISDTNEKSDFIEDLKTETDSCLVDFFTLQSSFPAINIGHLGTQSAFQRKGIGTAIIDLVAETFSNYRYAGCQFITIDALNNSATLQFYHQNNFHIQTNRDSHSSTRRMYRIL